MTNPANRTCINSSIFATINPGDEVIVLDPFYPQYNGKIELAGGKVVEVPMNAENGFAIRADWIEPHVTERMKASCECASVRSATTN